MDESRLAAAFERFDAIHRTDPRSVEFEGRSHPKELLHAVRLHAWVLKLSPNASAELQLASRSNAIRRWEIPRDSYPRTTEGYHRWRRALRAFHADTAGGVLTEMGFPEPAIDRVRELILMKNFPKDADTRVLEDADCLTFLETKFHDYIGQWDEAKTVRILKGTMKKMSPEAIRVAQGLPLTAAARELLRKAADSR